MKKIFSLLASIMLLTGCAETIALLGPTSALMGGGNIVPSTLSSAASYGVKKTTGKSPMQHALAYAEEKNPNKKKDRCLSFAKETKSEACYIAKKQISSAKKSASKKIKNVIKLPKSKVSKKIKAEQELPAQVKVKKEAVKKVKSEIVTVKKIKTEQELQLRSVESMLVESAMNKQHASHLRVAITKNYKIKDSSR
tara:strand:- start:42 stop:629 length:588 start_codon:yes stop_codon:yes gene_type:complete